MNSNLEYKNKITDEEIKLLPKIAFDGEIHLISDSDHQRQAAEYLRKHRIIGFDTESRASFKKGVKNSIALIQLSAGDKAFLIRVSKIKLVQEIIDILESPEHLKVGVALNEDIRELQRVSDFTPKGFIDLQYIMKIFGIEELGLKKITAIILEGQMSKAQRLSNWEANVLTESQQIYAATDAWVCEEIFTQLPITDEVLQRGMVTIKNRVEEEMLRREKAKLKQKKREERRKRYIELIEKGLIPNKIEDTDNGKS